MPKIPKSAIFTEKKVKEADSIFYDEGKSRGIQR